MSHRIYVSKKSNIEPDDVRGMHGQTIYGIRNQLGGEGILIFVDDSPGEEWPHSCSYISIGAWVESSQTLSRLDGHLRLRLNSKI